MLCKFFLVECSNYFQNENCIRKSNNDPRVHKKTNENVILE